VTSVAGRPAACDVAHAVAVMSIAARKNSIGEGGRAQEQRASV